MPNWWENMNFLSGNWGDIQSGAQSHYDPSQGRMDFMNPGGQGYFMPFTPGAMTGGGLTPNPVPGAATGTGMDPYYGYGYLFGAPGGNQTGPTSNVSNLSALGTPGTASQPLAALAPSQRTATGNLNLGQRQPSWNPPISNMFGPPGPPTTQGNVTYSNVGPMEQLLDRLFKGSVTGKGGGPIANQLFNLGLGQLPPALAEQIVGTTNEQFGKMGARFGTDLGTAQARGLAQAAAQQSLNAIREILGLGGTTAGFQFSRGESALQRAMQEFITQQQMDPLSGILQGLLGGG